MHGIFKRAIKMYGLTINPAAAVEHLRAAGDQDAAIYLTTPKSGKIRSVPLAPQVSGALALLGQRDELTAEDDLVFPGEDGCHRCGAATTRRWRRRASASCASTTCVTPSPPV
jgi:hypothetical protein